MELLPGLDIVAGPRHFFSELPDYGGAYVYLIRGEQGRHILIDTGYARFTDGIVRVLKSKGVAPEDIEIVALTHTHSDHIGGCAFFQRHGAKIAAHQAASELVDGTPPWSRDAAREKPQTSAGDATEPFRPDIRFADGDVIRAPGIELRVIHTPGHTRDSCAFVLERAGRRVLFAGDMWNLLIFGWGASYPDLLASIGKVRALGADYCCYGHSVLDELDWPKYFDKVEKNVTQGVYSVVDSAKADNHRVSCGLRLFAGLDR